MTDNTQAELDVNKLEQIIADHNKEMRVDMASEITGGTRSKAITDVITVKAILDWHNKQIEEVLDRVEKEVIGEDDWSQDTSFGGSLPKFQTVSQVWQSELRAEQRQTLTTLRKELDGGSDE